MSAYDRLQKQLEYMYNVILPDVYKEMAATKKAVRSCNTLEGEIHGKCEPGTCNCTFTGELNGPEDLQKHITLQQFREILIELLQQFEENTQSAVTDMMGEALAEINPVTQEVMEQYVSENAVTQEQMETYVSEHGTGSGVTREEMEEYVNDNATYNGVSYVQLVEHVDSATTQLKLDVEKLQEDVENNRTTKVDWSTYNGFWSKEDLFESYIIYKLRKLFPDERIELSEAHELKDAGAFN